MTAASKSRPWCECDPDYDGRCPYPCQIDADEKREAASAAKVWRNSVPCMCSVTVSAKGTVLDKSACPRHGKAAKS